MTVESAISKVVAAGNGLATVFSFSPLVIFDSSNLGVVKTGTDGVETALTEDADYTVTVASYPGTGSITYPATGSTKLANGETLTMKRVLPIEQTMDLENQGGYFPDTQETAFDKAAMIDLQQQEAIDRSIKIPVSDNIAPLDLPVASLRAGKALVFDANGQPTAGALSSVAVSAPMIPVVQAATLAAARAAFGLLNPSLATAGYLIRFDATGTLYEARSPANVRADIGANDAGNLTAGTLADARLSTNAKLQQAKAWVRFHMSGTTVVIDAAFNVSSITRNGVGDYTVNFNTNMASANYAWAACADAGAGANQGNLFIQQGGIAPTISACRFLNVISGVGSAEVAKASIVFFGS